MRRLHHEKAEVAGTRLRALGALQPRNTLSFETSDGAGPLNADLVVVGRSGRFRPLGSTALRVLRDNTRALLVVPVTEALPASEMAQHYRPAA
jgi:hypothetical protein